MSCEAPFLPFLASSWRIGFLCICSYLTRPPLVPPRHMGAEGPLWSPPGPRPIRTLHATFAFPSHRGRRCRYSCRASRYPEPGRGAGETPPQLSSAPLNPSPSLPSSFLPLPPTSSLPPSPPVLPFTPLFPLSPAPQPEGRRAVHFLPPAGLSAHVRLPSRPRPGLARCWLPRFPGERLS